MMELLKKYWQFIITTILTILAIVIALGIFYFQSNKALSYEIISISPLLSSSIPSEEQLQILYHGKNVQSPLITYIQIKNTGKVPIEKANFDGSLILDMGEKTKLLSIFTTEKNPKSINFDYKINTDNSKIEIMPTLLNPGDSVTLRIITSEDPPKPVLLGRIVGIKDIKLESGTKFESYILLIVGFVLYATTFSLTMFQLFVNYKNSYFTTKLPRITWILLFISNILSLSFIMPLISGVFFNTNSIITSMFLTLIAIVVGKIILRIFNLEEVIIEKN